MTDDPKTAKERYKSTVLLPKTDFPMKAGLQKLEPELQKRWDETGLYARIREARKGAKPWVLHDGPPYANGDAHTGTGMNKILKDMVVKFRTMQGFDSPYVPGWDCHGLPIEHKMLAEMGGTLPEGTTALQLREKCLEYANKYVDLQRAQFKSAGVLGRWEKPYLTTDPVYEANVLRVFSELFKRGFITRAKRAVHWSWAAQSALAEAELEYEDRTDPSVYVRFPVSSCGKDCKFREMVEVRPDSDDIWESLALLIWTTTPWTLPANVAVAAHEKAEYVLAGYTRSRDGRDAREHIIVAQALLSRVVEKAKLRDVAVLDVFPGETLRGVGYAHPFLETACPVVFADYVTLEDGTGLVHTAPGHGKEDFETGKRERLPVVSPVDEAGKFFTGERLRKELGVSTAFEDSRGWLAMLEGKNVFKANPLIVEKLREEGWLLHDEPIKHSYPHCWRTHTPVIFRATEQWFVQIDHADADKSMNPEGKTLRARILDEIAASRWFPGWGQKRISNMVENRPDWCISRQRYWGIPIPAFRVKATGEVLLTNETNAHVAALVEQHGSNIWFDDANWPAEKLLPPEVAARLTGKTVEKMGDIFDVWFEAGSSFQAVMRTDPELRDKATELHAALSLDDMKRHIRSLKKLGSMSDVIKNFFPGAEVTDVNEHALDHMEALIEAVPRHYWRRPENLSASERAQVAVQAGRPVGELDRLIEGFVRMRSMTAGMSSDPIVPAKRIRTPHAGMYLEGDDQHRGWFQVSLILSVATTGVAPFQDCLTCAFVVDEKGEKGSKSKGNMWPIDQGCRDLGADLIRLYFASLDTSSPVPVTYKLIQGSGEMYRKLRNTYRALVSNLFDFAPEEDALVYGELLPLDRWALSEAARTVETVTAAWERYEFHVAMRALFDFANVTLSSQYIDLRKDVLYCEAADSIGRRSAQTAYWALADALVRMCAPVMVHTAEEMWQHLPRLASESESVHMAGWPVSFSQSASQPGAAVPADVYLRADLELNAKYRLLLQVKAESDRILDRMRKEGAIGKGYDVNVELGAAPGYFAKVAEPEALEKMLPELLNVSAVSLDASSDHAALQDFEPGVDLKGLWLKVAQSAEQPCVRCFRRTGDVGKVKEHEHLCARCADVVGRGA